MSNHLNHLNKTILMITHSIPFGLGAKLRYMGYFASLLHPPGRKTWLLFSARDKISGFPDILS